MTKAFVAIMTTVALAAAALPAQAAGVGVYTGQRARVSNSIARTQQRNNAAIAHVQRSIAATRRNKF